jgi:excisionase family DNA binding protein
MSHAVPNPSEVGQRPTVTVRSRPPDLRETLREQALSSAIRKRAAGVPTYSVPEAAALLSISQEYLYRLIQAGGFAAVRMRSGRNQGRYVIPAKAVEQLLDEAASVGTCVESAAIAEQHRTEVAR